MTILQQACQDVPGFDSFYQKFLQRLTINSKSPSTIVNYSRVLAAMSLHFCIIPSLVTPGQVEEYLYLVKLRCKEESVTYFKLLISALRFVFRSEGLDPSQFKLPRTRRGRKLPVVLSREEIKSMMTIPCQLRHRLVIALLYGCGLRCGEVRNLRVTDVDLDRAVLHVRQGKGRKDRYVPMGSTLPVLLRRYLEIENPGEWLIPGKGRRGFFILFEPQYGKRTIQWAVKRAARLAGINKPVNVHSLRHTYATHLLEDGVSILSLKELLGHASIFSTLIYLRVAQVVNRDKCSPLDQLTGLQIFAPTQMRLDF